MLPQRTLRAGRWVEVIPRVERIIAFEEVGSPVNIIRPRLDAQVDDGARLPSVFCWRVFLRVELLDRVDRKNRPGCSLHSFGVDHGRSVVRIVVVCAVKDEIIVLGSVAVRTDGEKPSPAAPLHSRSQDHEILEIAAVQGEIIDGLVRKSSAQRVIGSLHQRQLFCHGDRFRYAAGLHGQIQTYVFRYFELDAAALDFLESRRLNYQFVCARRQAGCNVIARVIGLERSRHSRVHVGDGHVRAFDEPAALVGHGAQNAALLRLPGRAAQGNECE